MSQQAREGRRDWKPGCEGAAAGAAGSRESGAASLSLARAGVVPASLLTSRVEGRERKREIMIRTHEVHHEGEREMREWFIMIFLAKASKQAGTSMSGGGERLERECWCEGEREREMLAKHGRRRSKRPAA